jgi:hypothetical protein
VREPLAACAVHPDGDVQPGRLERADAVRIHCSRFIADHDDLQFALLLELKDEFDRLIIRL